MATPVGQAAPGAPTLQGIEAQLEECDKRELALATAYRQAERDRKFLLDRLLVEKQRLNAQADDDPDSDDEALTGCYTEIKNLILIEHNLVQQKALDEWARKEALFTSRVERKTKKVGNLKNEVYQLVGFFSVFQGVVLTAVSQSSLLHCNNWWSPIFLSVLASIVTIAGVSQKLLQISSFQKTIFSEEQALKDAVKRGFVERAKILYLLSSRRTRRRNQRRIISGCMLV